MTTTTQARPALRGAGRHRTPEALVFAGATTAALVHALDDAFVHRGPGLGLGQHALAGAIALVGAIAAVARVPDAAPGSPREPCRSPSASSPSSTGCSTSRTSAPTAWPSGDVTGVFAAIAGVALLALAAWIPFAHRGEGSAPAWRRWTVRALAVPVGIVAIFVTLLPIGFSIFDAHKAATPIGAPPDAAYRDVTFRASDGLRINGWYRPSRNGAAVLLVHGGGGDREGTVRHARMLVRHGYGVLMYDARGRGESEGSPNGYGWKWTKDVAGALGFLERRPDVQPGRIGALGLSTGADVVLEAAATRRDIRAVVTDGAAAGSFADWHRLQGTTAMTPFFWSQFAALRVFTGDAPGRPLADLVPRIAAPMLLISTRAPRGVRLQREVRAPRPRPGRALEHRRRAAHARSPRPPARVRAAGRRLPRPRPGLNGRRPLAARSRSDSVAAGSAPPTRTEEQAMATRQQVADRGGRPPRGRAQGPGRRDGDAGRGRDPRPAPARRDRRRDRRSQPVDLLADRPPDRDRRHRDGGAVREPGRRERGLPRVPAARHRPLRHRAAAARARVRRRRRGVLRRVPAAARGGRDPARREVPGLDPDAVRDGRRLGARRDAGDVLPRLRRRDRRRGPRHRPHGRPRRSRDPVRRRGRVRRAHGELPGGREPRGEAVHRRGAPAGARGRPGRRGARPAPLLRRLQAPALPRAGGPVGVRRGRQRRRGGGRLHPHAGRPRDRPRPGLPRAAARTSRPSRSASPSGSSTTRATRSARATSSRRRAPAAAG